MSKAEPFSVTFRPSGISIDDAGQTPLLHLARRAGVRVESVCGARGVCRSCAVRMSGEHVPKPSRADRESFSADQLAAGWRRACQTYPIGSCEVHVPAKTAGGLVSRGKDVDGGRVPIAVPVLARAAEPRCWRRGDRTIGPVDDGGPLGLAVDLGTTNIAAALVDMTSGEIVASGSKVNPQVVFGADVISRLTHALKGAEPELQQAAVDAIAELADDLTEGATGRIAEAAVVGNTVMQHLLLGLPIASLSRAPYSPAELNAVERPAAGLGFDFASGAVLYTAPSVAGFVGGDHMAALFEVLADPPPRRWAMLDIGTNTEIALCADGVITSASCASGPALEGGRVTCGMRAAPGAVDRVAINAAAEISTLDGRPAVGICGSGVLSIMAALKRAGLVNQRGRMELRDGVVRERAGTRELVLRDDGGPSALPIVFTQRDVREVQLAKAAIRTGLELLLCNAGIEADDLDRIIVAGAFGKFIDIDDAVAIGLLPDLPGRIVQVGNAAGGGVRRLVACADARRRVGGLARQVRYLELASRPDFQRMFMNRSLL